MPNVYSHSGIQIHKNIALLLRSYLSIARGDDVVYMQHNSSSFIHLFIFYHFILQRGLDLSQLTLDWDRLQ